MYDGQARGADQVAVIHDDARFYGFVNRNVHVELVDGQSTKKFLRGFKIEVLPGVHTLGVRFLDVRFGFVRMAPDLCWITFYAAAGGEYQIRSETMSDRARMWLVDLKTGEKKQCDSKQPGDRT